MKYMPSRTISAAVAFSLVCLSVPALAEYTCNCAVGGMSTNLTKVYICDDPISVSVEAYLTCGTNLQKLTYSKSVPREEDGGPYSVDIPPFPAGGVDCLCDPKYITPKTGMQCKGGSLEINYIAKEDDECGKSGAGLRSLHWFVMLGPGNGGQKGARLGVDSGSMDGNLYSPASLRLNDPSYSDVVYSEVGSSTMRQVKTSECLVDIEASGDSEGYKMSFYTSGDVSPDVLLYTNITYRMGFDNNMVPATNIWYLYQTREGSSPFVTYNVSNPNPGSTNGVLFSEVRGGAAVGSHLFSYDGSAWRMLEGGARETLRTETSDPQGNVVKTSSIGGVDGAPVATTRYV